MLEPILVSIIIYGFLHGLSPDHGWPLATIYAKKARGNVLISLASSLIISFGHAVSSIAVLLIYILFESVLARFLDLIIYIAVAFLLLLAIKTWFEDDGNEMLSRGSSIVNLKELFIVALILGFIHEEEVILLLIYAIYPNPIILMLIYIFTMTLSIIIASCIFYYSTQRLSEIVSSLDVKINKILAIVICGMAILIFLRI